MYIPNPLNRSQVIRMFSGRIRSVSRSGLLVFALMLCSGLFAQDGVEYSVPIGNTAAIRDLLPDQTLTNRPDFHASAFTNKGDTIIYRCLMELDLSGLDSEWIIDRAYFNLYGNPNSNRPPNQGFNDCWIERIVKPWIADNVTWETQPATTTVHRVALPQSWVEAEDLLELELTEMVRDMQSNTGGSHGLMLRLKDEDIFRSRVFASSAHPDPALHPELIVEYRTAADTGGTTALIDLSNSLDWQVGPNPFVDRLVVQADLPFAGEWTFSVFNASGQVVLRESTWAAEGPFRTSLQLGRVSVQGMHLMRMDAVDPSSPGRRAFAVRRLMRVHP
jgi:hypothetical protein